MLEGPPAGRGRGLEEGDYQEVEGEEGGGGEGEYGYHVLGEIGGEERLMRCQCPARPQCSQQQQSTPHYSTSNT